jgi:hypothetical protein
MLQIVPNKKRNPINDHIRTDIQTALRHLSMVSDLNIYESKVLDWVYSTTIDVGKIYNSYKHIPTSIFPNYKNKIVSQGVVSDYLKMSERIFRDCVKGLVEKGLIIKHQTSWALNSQILEFYLCIRLHEFSKRKVASNFQLRLPYQIEYIYASKELGFHPENSFLSNLLSEMEIPKMTIEDMLALGEQKKQERAKKKVAEDAKGIPTTKYIISSALQSGLEIEFSEPDRTSTLVRNINKVIDSNGLEDYPKQALNHIFEFWSHFTRFLNNIEYMPNNTAYIIRPNIIDLLALNYFSDFLFGPWYQYFEQNKWDTSTPLPNHKDLKEIDSNNLFLKYITEKGKYWYRGTITGGKACVK